MTGGKCCAAARGAIDAHLVHREVRLHLEVLGADREGLARHTLERLEQSMPVTIGATASTHACVSKDAPVRGHGGDNPDTGGERRLSGLFDVVPDADQ